MAFCTAGGKDCNCDSAPICCWRFCMKARLGSTKLKKKTKTQSFAKSVTSKRQLTYKNSLLIICLYDSPPCWPMVWFRRKLLRKSTGFWPADGKGKRFGAISRSGIGGNGGLCIFICGLILGRFPWKDGGWLDGIGGCIGNPCGRCCPGGLCGIGGAAVWPTGTGDPGGGTGGAEEPEGTMLPLCVSSEPPVNSPVHSPWFWG